MALEKAKDHGYLDVDPPFIEYDYDKYKPSGEGTAKISTNTSAEKS